MSSTTTQASRGVYDTVRAGLSARPATSIFVVALALRVAVAVVVRVTNEGTLFGDDVYFREMGLDLARGQTEQWTPYDHSVHRTMGAYLHLLGLAYRLFGTDPLVGQLVTAVLGAAAAAVVVRIACSLLPTSLALLAGLVVAVLPSQVLFSALTLKDPLSWLLLAVVAGSLATAFGGDEARWGHLSWGVAAVTTLGFVRGQTFLVAIVAFAIVLVVVDRNHLFRRMVAAACLVLVLPAALGMGPAGADLFLEGPSFDERRVENARGAATALVRPGARFTESTSESATPSGPTTLADLESGLTYLPRGITAFLLEPVPWREGGIRVQAGKADIVLWYPLLLLASVGSFSVIRRRRSWGVLAFPVLVSGALVVGYGLTEGNFGTAFRHRGEIGWAVALLAPVGASSISHWRRSRRPEELT